MQVIARRTLKEFWARHLQARRSNSCLVCPSRESEMAQSKRREAGVRDDGRPYWRQSNHIQSGRQQV